MLVPQGQNAALKERHSPLLHDEATFKTVLLLPFDCLTNMQDVLFLLLVFLGHVGSNQMFSKSQVRE